MIGESKDERNDRIRPYIANAREHLTGKGIPFVEKNKGLHFVVDNRFDFWPTTGKFISRKTGKVSRGVFRLLKEFEQ